MAPRHPQQTSALPPLPADMRREQAAQWERIDAALVPHLQRFLEQIERKRIEHATRVGWKPEQVGYLMVHSYRRRFLHVILADRDLDTGVPVAGLNARIFCYIEEKTGDIYKVSTDGKALEVPRGNVRDEDSAWRAITPFGVDSR